ncbi:MAG TPA: DUF1906 domain-containing protein [Longimicrobium sp.]|nr:DUF1906 domain-containing protein [Longimicrobium sp.]
MSIADAGATTASLPGVVQNAPSGLKGFDANTPISASTAAAFHANGYRFCVRYVGRTAMASYDLTSTEAKTILEAGLALMVVQHVLDPGWNPTESLGQEYGANAATFTRQIGVPPGVNVWCDLECVANGTAASDVIAYCNAWASQVSAAGYVPGLYVGYEPGLSSQQLYDDLQIDHYWGAYNIDGDDIPAPRGLQLEQKVGTGGTIGGVSTESYDDDVTMTDKLGGTAVWLTLSPQ